MKRWCGIWVFISLFRITLMKGLKKENMIKKKFRVFATKNRLKFLSVPFNTYGTGTVLTNIKHIYYYFKIFLPEDRKSSFKILGLNSYWTYVRITHSKPNMVTDVVLAKTSKYFVVSSFPKRFNFIPNWYTTGSTHLTFSYYLPICISYYPNRRNTYGIVRTSNFFSNWNKIIFYCNVPYNNLKQQLLEVD